MSAVLRGRIVEADYLRVTDSHSEWNGKLLKIVSSQEAYEIGDQVYFIVGTFIYCQKKKFGALCVRKE